MKTSITKEAKNQNQIVIFLITQLLIVVILVRKYKLEFYVSNFTFYFYESSQDYSNTPKTQKNISHYKSAQTFTNLDGLEGFELIRALENILVSERFFRNQISMKLKSANVY